MDKLKTEAGQKIAWGILFTLSFAHMLNDAMQSVIFAVYPLLQSVLDLNFAQIGMLTLIYQISASVFQPLFGYLFDRRPNAWFLPIGMAFTMTGLLLLSIAPTFHFALFAVLFSGVGSSVLHPEASRLTSLASGGQRGLAQSIFQVGGSAGFSFGPLFAALLISPYGQQNIAIFSIFALVAIVAIIPVCKWYSLKLKDAKPRTLENTKPKGIGLSRKTITRTLVILLLLIFSKYVYQASITSYYMFYLIDRFSVSERTAQVFLFVFLFASALGTLAGGPLGDKFGRRYVIWFSILGSAPFALALPYANLQQTLILSIIIGLILSSAFSAILVYAQELLPMKLGFISGMFFGLAFGIAGIASAVLGWVADANGIAFVYKICSFMPIMGAIAYFLPTVRALQAESKKNLEKLESEN